MDIWTYNYIQITRQDRQMGIHTFDQMDRWRYIQLTRKKQQERWIYIEITRKIDEYLQTFNQIDRQMDIHAITYR